MENPNDIRIKIGGTVLPLEYNMPFTMKQTRGTAPYFFNVMVSDISGLPAPGGGGAAGPITGPGAGDGPSGTPCSFLFETPAASGSDMIQWEWDSWYLVRVEPAKGTDDAFLLTFADERWKAEHKRIDASYNVQWPDGSYRAESLVLSTNERWQTKDAIEDALKKFGYFETIWYARTDLGYLPDNMGNSDAGGFVAGTFSEVLDPMLESANLDLIFIDRKPAIVERVGDTANKLNYLRTMPRIVDTVGSGSNGWELPRKLRIHHEVKMEVALEKVESSSDRTTSGSDNAFLNEPANVMPRFRHEAEVGADWWKDKDGDTAKSEWVEIDEHITELFGTVYDPVERTIARNWFLPLILPLRRKGPMEEIWESADPTANSLLALRKMVITDYLRKSWRRLWRIEYPTDNRPSNASAPTIRRISGLKMGRLMPGGDATSKGSVFCDWCEQTIHAISYKPGHSFTKEFGVNHPYVGRAVSPNDPTTNVPPAPFNARFISENGKELIFVLEEVPHGRIGTSDIYPALYASIPNFGNPIEVVNDEYWALNQLNISLSAVFRMRVFLFGRLIANAQDTTSTNAVPAGIENRSYVHEIDLFPEGGIDSFDLKVDSMTANFGFSLDQVKKALGSLRNEWPELLLNRDKITENAERIGKQVLNQYSAGEAGGIVTPGVEAMKQGICTAGSIHEASVTVGDPDLWAVRCQFIVMPNVGKVTLDPKEKGRAAPIIDWS